MNAARSFRLFNILLLLAATAFLFAGCQTMPKIDWNKRIGHYTFDQAVQEMGPPDKYAPLKNGTVIADWIIQRGSTQVYYGAGFGYGYGYGYAPYAFPGYYSVSPSPNYYLQLNFGPDGQLQHWEKVVRY